MVPIRLSVSPTLRCNLVPRLYTRTRPKTRRNKTVDILPLILLLSWFRRFNNMPNLFNYEDFESLVTDRTPFVYSFQ